MSVYLTFDATREIKKRIASIGSIKENLIDAKAELEEVRKRNPMVKTKGSGDMMYTGNTGSSETNVCIALPMREKLLEDRIAQYEAIIHDYERGWNLLSEQQKTYMTERFVNFRKQFDVAKELGINERTARRLESEALRIMVNELIKI